MIVNNGFMLRAGLAALLLAVLLPCQALQADWQEWASARDSSAPVEVSEEVLKKYDWTLSYADGSGKLGFKELAESGDPFVLMWWKSDCPLCHQQLPFVQKLQKEIEEHKLKLRLVTICIDTDERECLDYAREKGITFDILLDGHARRTDSKYRVRDLGTPLTYVFEPGGKLATYLTGFKQQYSRTIYTELGITLPTR